MIVVVLQGVEPAGKIKFNNFILVNTEINEKRPYLIHLVKYVH